MFNGVLIGTNIEIVGATDPSLVRRRGTILYESKYTLTIEINETKMRATIPKVGLILEITKPTQTTRIFGADIEGTPQERIKN